MLLISTLALVLATPASPSSIAATTVADDPCTEPLCGSPETISVSQGGEQEFVINAGTACGGMVYWLMGSMTGTSGMTVMGSTLPLTFDSYTTYTLAHPNVPPLVHTVSLLDGAGAASGVKVSMPPWSSSSLIGVTAYHAFASFDLLGTGATCIMSNAVSVVFVP